MNNSSAYYYEATEMPAGYTGLAYWLYLFLVSSYQKQVITITWSLLIVFGALGNGLVVYIAVAYKKLNDITNCFIVNLAITDLLFIVFCIPFTIYIFTYDDWVFGVTPCKLSHFMSHASVQSTCLTLTAMTIHRCNLIIANKTQAQNAALAGKGRRTVLLVTLIIWLVSFVLASPDLVYYTAIKKEVDNQSYTSCQIDTTNFSSLSKYYFNVANFLSIATTYVIPLLVIILSYGRLLSHLQQNQHRLAKFKHNTNGGVVRRDQSKENSKTSKEITRQLESEKLNSDKLDTCGGGSEVISGGGPSNLVVRSINRNKSPSRRGNQAATSGGSRKRRVTTMVAVLTLAFGICWLPTHLFIILRRVVTFSEDSNMYIYLTVFKLIAHTLSYLTPVVNTILYAFYNENFRQPLADIWMRATCRTKKANQLIKNNKMIKTGIGATAV